MTMTVDPLTDPFTVPTAPEPFPTLVVTTPAPTPTITAGGPALDRFEGAQVSKAETKLTGTYVMAGEEATSLAIDDRVRVIAEYRVVGVRFEANANGDLVRTHLLKVIEAERCPYDPSDPTDDGIWRSRPKP